MLRMSEKRKAEVFTPIENGEERFSISGKGLKTASTVKPVRQYVLSAPAVRIQNVLLTLP